MFNHIGMRSKVFLAMTTLAVICIAAVSIGHAAIESDLDRSLFVGAVLIIAAIVARFLSKVVASETEQRIATVGEVLVELSAVTSKVEESVHDASAALEEQASISTQQSVSVSDITSAMEELSATSSQIAENSAWVVEVADSALKSAEEGSLTLEQLVARMAEIGQSNQTSIKEIIELGEMSKKITKVMEIINGIADQTKLIAFNASIEAAAAGDSGRRFGVVAGEIRRLADSVANSTSEIERNIEEMQAATSRLVITSEEGAKGIRQGIDTSSQTLAILGEMLAGAKTTTEAATQISAASQQQKTASAQVVTALKEMSTGTAQSSAAIAQINSTTTGLSELADRLRALVSRLEVDGAKVTSETVVRGM